MAEIEQLQQQNHRTFLLVCLNFFMFLILFVGLGYVAWQSSTLISKLEKDLERVEQAVGQFQSRIQQIDVDTMMPKMMESAKENIEDSIKSAINQSDFFGSLGSLTAKVDAAQDRLKQIGEVVREANEKLQKIETEQLAQAVSYNILKGLGDGFTKAAESKKPSLENRD